MWKKHPRFSWFPNYQLQLAVHQPDGMKKQLKKVELEAQSKAKKNHLWKVVVCPEQESNLHILADTRFWVWRVYQFRHLGLKRVAILQLSR